MIALAGGARAGGMGREGVPTLRGRASTAVAGVVQRFALRFADALRYARSRATQPIADDVTRNLAKRCLSSDRSRSLEDTVTLLVDASARGAAVEAEAAVHELVAAIREARGPRELPTLNEAWKAEEDAEAEREKAEVAVITTQGKCAASRERWIRARAAYIIADEDMKDVIYQFDTVAA